MADEKKKYTMSADEMPRWYHPQQGQFTHTLKESENGFIHGFIQNQLVRDATKGEIVFDANTGKLVSYDDDEETNDEEHEEFTGIGEAEVINRERKLEQRIWDLWGQEQFTPLDTKEAPTFVIHDIEMILRDMYEIYPELWENKVEISALSMVNDWTWQHKLTVYEREKRKILKVKEPEDND
ncbi:hypothetical protein [Megasphaera hominis]|jgi:hypothetical protein|uniref:Uncharacterized protein n=1 Tax=Megasphaera hominis TaxID=159836 RepID=A0ABR6VJ73_9FIRM|nr:hypothetical protein [Megasphaera hominis]MBC3537340.1 hypothetical protein [Megasphaera hominis]